MNIRKEIIDHEPVQVQTLFRQWEAFMEERLHFWQLPDDGFDIHTESHCERVLFLALKIGRQRNLSTQALTALAHASIFHDTRRKDNYLDLGHGDRAADYYHQFCEQEKLCFLPEAFTAIKFHDRDDTVGNDYIHQQTPVDAAEWLEVYHDLKDADALDRYRLGPWALDASFLRTPEARALMPFAERLVHDTIDPTVLKRTMDLTRPFADKFTGK